MIIDGKPAGVEGTYLEIVEEKRVVFTWSWVGVEDFMVKDTLLTIEIEPDGEGTKLKLTHSGFTAQPPREAHGVGLEIALDAMETLLA
jgi:uncharacterized protein YndB with AHSA1/START domain|tara:strand:- start:1289 stop:1552 length:264 start_codon:yes stop_codon:yes gene_type:complete